MEPKGLILFRAALADLGRRQDYLSGIRGQEFAETWKNDLLEWVLDLAETGAVYGTRHPKRGHLRTVNFRKTATLLVDFTETELRVVRIYFPGQGWSR
ncbi:MAG: hypothetical protein QNJ16_05540 [Rhodobacter sp.]|nr:hypothetical protein [Rhodobacter sp.]